MSEIILALDQSSRAIGWACSAGGSGVWLPGRLPASAARIVNHRIKCGWAMECMMEAITEHEPSVIVLEDGGGRTDMAVQRVRGAVLAATAIRSIAVDSVHPSTWRSWAKRNSDWTPDQKSDERDAQMILAYWLAVRGPKMFGEAA